MSIQYTHTTLVAAMKTYAEDTDPDFVANIDDMIGKAELRILKDLDLELFEQWLNVTVSGGNRTVAKPSDVIYVNDLHVRTPAAQLWLECPRRSFEYCLLYAPSEVATGIPAFYSELDTTNIYVVPTPDQSYSGGNAKVRATIRPTGLLSSNNTTWLGDNQADLLFDACMIEVWAYLKHKAKLDEAASKYQSLLPGIAKEIEQSVRKTYKQVNTRKQGADS